MSARTIKAGALLAALALAGCTGSSLEDIAPKSQYQLSLKLTKLMSEKGMAKTAPILVRVFKEENVLEVWKQKPNGRYDIVVSYPMCKWSGKLGPKFKEGDRQAPEGFYTITPAQMNPNSKFYLAFNTGYPNAYDRVNGRNGAHLMVHGACSSSGCYSMTDGQMQEIYAFARDAFAGGQGAFQFQAFPFRMTASNMARYKDDPNFGFWKMLKEGYDHFEITKVPPKVDVCEKRYVFNRFLATPAEGEQAEDLKFSAAGSCPSAAPLPDTLATAYQSYQSTYSSAFSTESEKSNLPPPRASIVGTKEADLVADWSRKRSKGERVPMQPPSMRSDGSVVVTSTMGRIDSPEGRRRAAIDAEEDAKKRAHEEKLAAIERAKVYAAEKKAAKAAAKEAAKNPPPPPAATAEAEEPSRLKKIINLFGG